MKVKVYGSPTCSKCHLAKIFLDEHKIDFEDIDISAKPEMAKLIVDKTRQRTLPVIEVSGKFLVGFDKNILAQQLGID